MATDFTPWASLAGGLMIGLAAVLLMALHGRILGATGILGGLLRFGNPADWRLRAALVLGMAVAPLAVLLATGRMPAMEQPVPAPVVALGGLIVGLGVSYGGGCTSGHGVCGIGRLSRRSVVATAVFMATAIATVLVTRHAMRLASAFLIGLLFGLGIALSGMINPAKVLNFFDIAGTWDPSLAFVMAGALAVVIPGYRLVFRRSGPRFDARFQLPENKAIDRRLMLGSAAFGVGWGLAGFCPGGALPALGTGDPLVVVFLAALVAGMLAARWLQGQGPAQSFPA
jgi:uncharacterized protein